MNWILKLFKPKFPYGTGAKREPLDQQALRFNYDEVFGDPTPITDAEWDTGFNIYTGIPIPVGNQGASLSCTSQATSNYGQVLEWLENKIAKIFSPRWIYSQTFLSFGGSYIWKAMDLVTKLGFALESEVPSEPETESHMRDISDNTHAQSNLTYKAKSYASIPNRQSIDFIASVIKANNGVVSGVSGGNTGWGDAFVVPPATVNDIAWGHAIFLCGFHRINGKKYIIFRNSWGSGWGDQGYGYLGEDYILKGYPFTFDLYTLIDLPDNWNQTTKPQYTFNNVLKYGMRNNPDVKALQDILKYEGCLDQRIPSTGNFLDLTAKAVIQWQIKWGIIPNAQYWSSLSATQCGPKSLLKLNELYN